jgi:flagellar basal-body rod protein FlgB
MFAQRLTERTLLVMISQLPLFQIYEAMARHAASAQDVSAGNIARAGEPGYKAVEIESFEDFLARAQGSGAAMLRSGDFQTQFSNAPAAPNGNTVSVEREVFNSAAAMGQHSMALSVYGKMIDLMRTAIGKRA